ncbi:MAG: chorismate mutase [Epsilonproteobacteria bacterium]|nr:chorismate mutase [Campylobacterota bacterium]
MIEAKSCTNITDIRTAIDEIDNSIVQLISKRSEYVKEASRFKKDENAVKDPNRVAKVIASKKELALKYGASPKLIGNIYKMMIDFFIKEEMKEWKLQLNENK